MEVRTYASYIEMLFINFFDCSTFSPDNSANIFFKLKEAFYKDHAYWQKGKEQDGIFFIEFKKYGENRKKIFLKFSVSPNIASPREIIISLVDEELKLINDSKESIPLSKIWRDHSILIKKVKDSINRGLDLSEEVNE